MANPAATDYRCPSRHAPEKERLAWLKETKGQSLAWLQTQPSYKDFQNAIAMFNGRGGDLLSNGLSNVKAGEVRRDIRELVETLADVDVVSAFKSDNPAFYDKANELNKLNNAWWYHSHPKEKLKACLQLCAVMGKGFLGQEWDPDLYGKGRGDIGCSAYGPHEVLPVQLPRDHDYQKAYAVHIVNEMPISMAHRKFWRHMDKITADRQSPSWLNKGMEKLAKFLSPVLNLLGARGTGPSTDPVFPTADIIYTYIQDEAVNETGKTIVMGEVGTMWEYSVPSLGTMIDSGLKNPVTKEPLMRPVTHDEARIYPMRRLIIWCSGGVLYDDTSYWWHGQVPVTSFDLDQWAWEAVGRPLTYDTVELEHSMTRLMRSIDDSANTRLSPPLVINEDVTSEDLGEDFDPRIPAQTIKLSTLQLDAIKPLLPAEFYNVPAFIPDWIDRLQNRIQRIIGVLDAQALVKARQMPASDDMEKLQELAGPLIKGMSGSIELSITRMGEQWKYLAYEFYDVKRRVQIRGKDGVTPEDVDVDPGMMIPSHLPGEDDQMGSRFTRIERAKWAANQMYFFITPGDLHRITQTTQKLLLIQLSKAGVPVDWWTFARYFQLSDFAPEPEGTKNMLERWVAQQRMMMEFQAIGQQMMQQAAPGAPAQRGRPPSGLESPQLVQKDGGTRTTISQSGG